MRVGSADAPIGMPLRVLGGRHVLPALVAAAIGCAASPSGQVERGVLTAVVAPARNAPKALTIAFPIDPTAFAGGMLGLGAATVPSRYFKEFTNAYLTTYDPQDEPVPWLAAELPSLDNGTWRVLDDGRMEVTWKVRRGVKWHDGAELSSDDLKFGWEIGKDAATQVAPQSVARFVEAVDTPDPYTAVFTWAQVGDARRAPSRGDRAFPARTAA